jgi:hypothetical protein
MIELTEQQSQELQKANGDDILVCDPQTHLEYVLVRRDLYAQLTELPDEDVRASGELVDRIMAEDDAHDPYLQSYQSIAREGQP